jgi:hypothetical protein
MASSGTITIQYSGGGLNPEPATITKSSSGRVQWQEDIATATTDGQVNCPTIDVSELVLLYINSTQDITIETNADDATGGNTLTLKANEPYVWWTSAPFVNVITEDIVTNVFITNTSGATATITFEAILDTTP